MRKLAAAFAVALVACSNPPPAADSAAVAPPPPPAASTAAPAPSAPAPAASSDAPAIGAAAPAGDDVRRSNEVAARVHKTLAQTEKGNLFTSPTSLRLALGLAYAGARGATATEMASAFQFGDAAATTADAKAERAAWQKLEGKAIQLRIATRLWGNKATTFDAGYLARAQDGWGGGLEALDFEKQPDPSRITINGWVEKNTEGRIKDLLPAGSVDALTRLVLTNAVYFKGKWQTPFDKKDTQPGSFTPFPQKNLVQVPMMRRTASFAYAEDGDVRLASIPYGQGEASMVIVLPTGTTGIAPVEARLSGEQFHAWNEKLAQGARPLQLVMPKVSLSWGGSVRSVLEALGMKAAFTDAADFGGIAAMPLKITGVFHKTFLAIDEEGTEAAAATGIVIGTRSLPPPPMPFVVDRPFLFYLRDTATGRVLFLGRIQDPGAK